MRSKVPLGVSLEVAIRVPLIVRCVVLIRLALVGVAAHIA